LAAIRRARQAIFAAAIRAMVARFRWAAIVRCRAFLADIRGKGAACAFGSATMASILDRRSRARRRAGTSMKIVVHQHAK
jgi:hypothetical protein